MKSVKLILIYICLTIIFLTGCTTEVNENDEIMEAENFIKVFSSKKFNGRLVGTSDNNQATQWISDKFHSIGLEPYFDNGYLHRYTQETYLPENQKHELVATFKDGKVKKYTYGEDFLEQNNVEVNILGSPVSVDIYSSNASDSILLLEDLKLFSDYYNKKGEFPSFKCILVKRENFKKTIVINDNAIPIIQVSKRLYDDLIKDLQCRLDIIFEFEPVQKQVYNVVGKISGKNSNEAIVLSAHFDHVGIAGNTVFQGALDNSSGVWVLLKLAEELKSFSDSNKIDRDIVICAFNGEESGRKGSQAFVEQIQNDYNHIININLDTFGAKGDKTLCVSGDSHVSRELLNAAEKFFKNRNFNCIIEENELTSDHISFSNKHLPSINIGQLKVDLIHTNLDTYDYIDYEFLQAIEKTILDFVKTYSKDELYSTINHSECTLKDERSDIITEEITDEDRIVLEMIDKESKILPFNKYKVIMVNNHQYVVSKNYEYFENIELVKSFYKDLNIPKTYNDYKLDSITIVDNFIPDIDISKIEINKEYERPMKIENISSIRLMYSKNEGTKPLGFSVSIIKNSNDTISDESLPKMSIEINGESYELIYDRNTKKIWRIRKTLSNDNNIYTIDMLRGMIITISNNDIQQAEVILSDLSIEDIEDVKTFIQSIKVNIWSNILKVSEKR